MEDPMLSAVPVAELAWPGVRVRDLTMPVVDFTGLSKDSEFKQFLRHIVQQLHLCSIHNDEDMLKWMVNYESRQSRVLGVMPHDYLVLRCFAVLCSEMPEVVSRHWDVNLLFMQVAAKQTQRVGLDALRLTFEREDVAMLKMRIAQGLRYAQPMAYTPSEERLRKRPRDTNLVVPMISRIS
jgi:hypothetical protein